MTEHASPRGSVGVGGEHASHQGYCINTLPGMCTSIHMRVQSVRLHGDLSNIMNKLDKVEFWSQQTWLRLNGKAIGITQQDSIYCKIDLPPQKKTNKKKHAIKWNIYIFRIYIPGWFPNHTSSE